MLKETIGPNDEYLRMKIPMGYILMPENLPVEN
jgi:hypothetical protein